MTFLSLSDTYDSSLHLRTFVFCGAYCTPPTWCVWGWSGGWCGVCRERERETLTVFDKVSYPEHGYAMMVGETIRYLGFKKILALASI